MVCNGANILIESQCPEHFGYKLSPAIRLVANGSVRDTWFCVRGTLE